MSIENIPEWATSGTKTQPGAGEFSTGYVEGEQVGAPQWNYLRNEEREKINETIERAPDGFPPNLGDTDHLVKKYIPDNGDAGWSQAYDYPNWIQGGNGKAYVDTAMYITTTGEKKLMALDAATPAIDVYDISTWAYESTSGVLGDLPSGSSETWEATCFCTDGTYVDVCFQDTNVNPNETHRIQSYDIATWSGQWGATGVAMPGTGTSSAHDQVAWVGVDRIATTNTWNTISSSASAAVSVWNTSSGTLVASGAGDNPEVGGTHVARRICGDGTNAFFTDTNANVSSLLVATPTSGLGGGGWPFSGGVADECYDIVFIGQTIVTSWAAPTNNYVLRYHQAGTADHGGMNVSIGGDTDRIFRLAFDGLAIWGRGENSTTHSPYVIRLNIGHIGLGSNEYTPGYHRTGIYVFWPDTTTLTDDIRLSPLLFDGRDLIITGNRAASTTMSGYLFRLPRAVLR